MKRHDGVRGTVLAATAALCDLHDVVGMWLRVAHDRPGATVAATVVIIWAAAGRSRRGSP